MLEKEKYSVSFTAGALLLSETERVIDYLINGTLEESKKELIANNKIQINSESSRERVLNELVKRTKYVDKTIWNEFVRSSSQEKKILLLYVCYKTYKLMLDFASEEILNKWRTRNTKLFGDEVEYFLHKKSEIHPEINQWTEKTRKKAVQVILHILSEVGLLINNTITPLEANDKFWTIFIKLGDPWFLELALLNKQQRDKIYELVK